MESKIVEDDFVMVESEFLFIEDMTIDELEESIEGNLEELELRFKTLSRQTSLYVESKNSVVNSTYSIVD